MTTIDRLGILGIRSYGTEEETFIKFFKPLTIILGRNGSGKSTVIEAVKMATTGDLPPNTDKGAAFIHDPRIDNESETKAKIRLMFTNIRGDQYVVSRHFQLTIKPGPRGIGQKTEFKTLDQTLKRMDASGSGSTSSYRCSDLNSLLPEVMRVTKPVLNNVIFVHQEDSLWPLGDSKKLKEKFDDIFSATRYTKALDTIRRFRRDQFSEIKVVGTELLRYEDKVRALEKVRHEVDEIQVQFDSLRKGQEKLTESISDKKEELGEATGLQNKWVKKREELRELETEKIHCDRDKKEKFANLQVHNTEDSDEEIRLQIERLNRCRDDSDKERAKRLAIIGNLSGEIDMKREEYNARLGRKGELQEKAKQHEERIKKLNEMKINFHKQDSVFGKAYTDIGKRSNAPNERSTLEEWTTVLNEMLKDGVENVRKVNDQGRKEEDTANENLNNIRLRLESRREDERRKIQQLDENRTQLSSIRRELRSVVNSETSILEAESKLKTDESRLTDTMSKNNTKALESSINKNRRDMGELRDDLESSRRLRERLVADQAEQGRLTFSVESAKTKRKQVGLMLDEFHDILCDSTASLKLLEDNEDNPDFTTIDRQLSQFENDERSIREEDKGQLLVDIGGRLAAKRDNLVQGCEDDVSNTKSSLSSLSAQRTDAKQEYEKCKKQERQLDSEFGSVVSDLSGSESEMSEISTASEECGFDVDLSLSGLVAKFQHVRISSDDGANELKAEHVKASEEMQKKLGDTKVKVTTNETIFRTGKNFAQNDLKSFEDEKNKHRCPACGVKAKKNIEQMRTHLKSRVDKFSNPQSLHVAQQWKDTIESTEKVVRQLHAKGCFALSCLDKCKSSHERLRTIERACDKAEAEDEKMSRRLQHVKSKVGGDSACDSIGSRRMELKQALNDLAKLQRDSNQIRESVAAITGESKSLSQVDAEVRETEDNMSKLQENIDRESRSLEREREELRICENRVHVSRNQCLELKAQTEKLKRVKKEKEDMSKAIKEAEASIGGLKNEVASLESQVEDYEITYASVRSENEVGLGKATVVLSNRKVEVQAWKDCYHHVDAYEKEGKQGDVEKLIQSLAGIEKLIKTKTGDLKAQENEVQSASDSQKETDSRIRNLRDNQKYRLQEQASNINSRNIRNVRAEIDEVVKENGGEDPKKRVFDLTNDLNLLQSQFHATKGKKHVIKEAYEKKKKELDECEKEGSRRKFDECRIKKQTMELASHDLERYHRALDQALMAFHTLKMSSINRTIKELWQQTYRGTDIDEIEISSDHNNEKSETGGVGVARRNFNYRVIMTRGQAGLDMRGRCSAGQKVLACMVIRLALAESFCTDCGILALDEPTTNLDEVNRNSLADALRAIIENRKKQKNFQLVLITHDEAFIDRLGARDYCSEYFKIFKNDNHKSSAQIESLLQVGG